MMIYKTLNLELHPKQQLICENGTIVKEITIAVSHIVSIVNLTDGYVLLSLSNSKHYSVKFDFEQMKSIVARNNIL
jgi:hypothetical protein